MAPTVTAKKFDPSLEGLRAIACMMVLFCHLTRVPDVDPGMPEQWFHNYTFMGKEAVLLFFLISGYVIGLVTEELNFCKANTRDYLWKRFIRLAPLCWLAIALSVWARPIDKVSTILGNVLFMQNIDRFLCIVVQPMKANGNLWSLNFEKFYYIAFLLVWWWRPSSRRMGQLIVGMIVLSLTGWFFKWQPRWIAPFSVGGAYWFGGLWLAWYGTRLDLKDSLRKLPWASIWILFLATAQLSVLLTTFRALGWVGWARPTRVPYISVMDLQMLPIGLIILAGATSRKLPLPKLIWTLSWAQPVLLMLFWFATNNQELLSAHRDVVWELGAAALLMWWTFGSQWMARLCPIGMISYGIYIFGPPMQWVVVDHLGLPTGTMGSYLLRLTLCVTFTFVIAYVAEILLYPHLRRYLEKKLFKKEPKTLVLETREVA